ncbi:MAG: bifunctional biotin--[acetyl-CoA-carboxylase] synthetase/biotin operon repressor, partial [Thermoplasmata archaeon]|nr:bifunctional biotin--[acetyl-CoA-carboxylase] synthetase/biotin operon repressor [Thermoplasmata archaeon]
MSELRQENVLGQHATLFSTRPYLYRESVDSTNQALLGLAEKGAQEGTVLVAETQKRGKGRLERHWSSPPGGLWFSLLLRPKRKEITLLPLLAGVAVACSLRKIGLE